jgi:hypothetical protein
MSFKDIQKSEEAEASTFGQENSLQSMFSLSRSQSINHANIEEVEINPQAAWKLPAISSSKDWCHPLQESHIFTIFISYKLGSSIYSHLCVLVNGFLQNLEECFL